MDAGASGLRSVQPTREVDSKNMAGAAQAELGSATWRSRIRVVMVMVPGSPLRKVIARNLTDVEMTVFQLAAVFIHSSWSSTVNGGRGIY
eukprot:4488930-Pyramimonas_sp.AAC.1